MGTFCPSSDLSTSLWGHTTLFYPLRKVEVTQMLMTVTAGKEGWQIVIPRATLSLNAFRVLKVQVGVPLPFSSPCIYIITLIKQRFLVLLLTIFFLPVFQLVTWSLFSV